MVPPDSHKLTGVRGTQVSDQPAHACRYGTLTRSGAAFQPLRVSLAGCVCQTLQPRPDRNQDGLGCSRFARHYSGNLMLMSSRRATEMFQFARLPPTCLCIQQGVSRHDSGGVAPFGISRIIARMQLPLNVSPVSASFIGLQRRGIHLVLLLACLFMRTCVLRLRSRSRTCAPSFPLFSCFSFVFCPRQN